MSYISFKKFVFFLSTTKNK